MAGQASSHHLDAIVIHIAGITEEPNDVGLARALSCRYLTRPTASNRSSRVTLTLRTALGGGATQVEVAIPAPVTATPGHKLLTATLPGIATVQTVPPQAIPIVGDTLRATIAR